MPIYEFECSGCGHRFDRLQKLSDTDPSICPACAAPQLRRKVSAPSFRLAGSGWYETDFKSDKERKHNLAGDAAQPKESSGDKPVEPAKTGGTAEGAKPAAAEKSSTAAGKPAGG